MGQMGFFDIANRYAGLDAQNDPRERGNPNNPDKELHGGPKLACFGSA